MPGSKPTPPSSPPSRRVRGAVRARQRAPANLAAPKKVDSWSQPDFIEKGGWATTASVKGDEHASAVAKACASLLAPG
jgi:hypothetical protein